MSELGVRTNPQAPRTLDCAMYWGHGPDKIATSGFAAESTNLLIISWLRLKIHKAHRIRGKRLRLPSHLQIENASDTIQRLTPN
jgi:hypothetical protein